MNARFVQFFPPLCSEENHVRRQRHHLRGYTHFLQRRRAEGELTVKSGARLFLCLIIDDLCANEVAMFDQDVRHESVRRHRRGRQAGQTFTARYLATGPRSGGRAETVQSTRAAGVLLLHCASYGPCGYNRAARRRQRSGNRAHRATRPHSTSVGKSPAASTCLSF